jgi:hypothetical protein
MEFQTLLQMLMLMSMLTVLCPHYCHQLPFGQLPESCHPHAEVGERSSRAVHEPKREVGFATDVSDRLIAWVAVVLPHAQMELHSVKVWWNWQWRCWCWCW